MQGVGNVERAGLRSGAGNKDDSESGSEGQLKGDREEGFRQGKHPFHNKSLSSAGFPLGRSYA
jgi:hypothetical protein